MDDCHNLILCLGSNVEQAHDKIKEGLKLLISRGCSPIDCTEIYPSSSGYQNQIVRATCDADYENFLRTTKGVEAVLGRKPEHKEQGIVPIDIDIVVFDGNVMRPLDYQSDYYRQGMAML